MSIIETAKKNVHDFIKFITKDLSESLRKRPRSPRLIFTNVLILAVACVMLVILVWPFLSAFSRRPAKDTTSPSPVVSPAPVETTEQVLAIVVSEFRDNTQERWADGCLARMIGQRLIDNLNAVREDQINRNVRPPLNVIDWNKLVTIQNELHRSRAEVMKDNRIRHRIDGDCAWNTTRVAEAPNTFSGTVVVHKGEDDAEEWVDPFDGTRARALGAIDDLATLLLSHFHVDPGQARDELTVNIMSYENFCNYLHQYDAGIAAQPHARSGARHRWLEGNIERAKGGGAILRSFMRSIAWATETPNADAAAADALRARMGDYETAYNEAYHDRAKIADLAEFYLDFNDDIRSALTAYFDNAVDLRVAITDVEPTPITDTVATVTFTRHDEFVDHDSNLKQNLHTRPTVKFVNRDGQWRIAPF